MITRVMPNLQVSANNYIKKQSNPSFGMARLNEVGRNSADEFGYQRNEFLNGNLFHKAGIFDKAAITEELDAGYSFDQICTTYGCSKNPVTNAQFIKTQILSTKGTQAIKNVDPDELGDGLLKLYNFNYDNPELTTKETKALLNKVAENMRESDYVKNIGILTAGVQK